MNTKAFLLFCGFAVLGSIAATAEISYPSLHDYSYNAAMWKTQHRFEHQPYLRVNIPFDIVFQGVTYQGFWVSNDSQLYFTVPPDHSNSSISDQTSKHPEVKISIASKRYLKAQTLNIWQAYDNMTVEFSAYDKFESKRLHWLVMFHRNQMELFDIDIKQNQLARTISEIRNGTNSKDIDCKTARLTRYYQVNLKKPTIGFGWRVFSSIVSAIGMMGAITSIAFGIVKVLFKCLAAQLQKCKLGSHRHRHNQIRPSNDE